MKSIIQEAPSIVKAIEKGWERAGRPNEFKIKIFEESKKNFLGMTIKSAKVGIFFEDNIQRPQPHQPVKKVQKKPFEKDAQAKPRRRYYRNYSQDKKNQS